MSNIVRSKKNWEAEFSNVTYAQAKEIEQDKNTKEMAIYKERGISEPIYNKDSWIAYIDIRAYNDNALKNDDITLIEGRLPQNSNEIIISKSIKSEMYNVPIEIGQRLKVKVQGRTKEYIIVGITEKLNIDGLSLGGKNVVNVIGAITYYSEDIQKDSDIVTATILTNNIQKIYDTSRVLANKLGIQENSNNSSGLMLEELEKNMLDELVNGNSSNGNSKLDFNNTLLFYECVPEAGTEFAKTIFIVRHSLYRNYNYFINNCNIYSL